MLPEVTLRGVSRDDVDRIAWWLEDRELSTRWLGHYGCGDPVHGKVICPSCELRLVPHPWSVPDGDPDTSSSSSSE